MRLPRLAVAVASSSTIITPLVVAFVPPAPLTAAAGCREALPGLRIQTQKLLAVASDVSGEGCRLPPNDETFGPVGRVREFLAAPESADGAGRYGRYGVIWRTYQFGYLPATVVSFKEGSKWIVQQERRGNVYQKLPRSAVDIFGEKSLLNLSEQPQQHAIGRKPLSEALSPKAVLELQPNVNAILEKLILRLEGFAKSGEEVAMMDELMDFTLESIVGVFFGDYATSDFMEDVKRYMPAIGSGLLSLPVRFPWPLNKIPVFSYGRSMDARGAFSDVIRRVIEERQADISSAGEVSGSTGGKSAGVLDSFIEIQQRENGSDPRQAGVFDDEFIVDNVLLSLFAGADTTSTTLTRILQLLATADEGKGIVASLLQEQRNRATSDDDELDDTTGTGKGGASREGVLGAFPLLDAVILEAARLYPAVNSVFRKAKTDLVFDGYLIPEGEVINWNWLHQMRSPSLYPSPKKFCPFRFLHGHNSEGTGTSTSTSPGSVPVQQQPLPPMFGGGRHMCPGRELAKLEMIVFLKAFLTKFDYELVEGQSLKGELPVNGPKDKLRVFLKLKAAA